MKEKNKIKILNTEPNRQTLICYLNALGKDTTGLNQEISEKRDVNRNGVVLKPVKQGGWFKWGAEQLGLFSGELNLELSQVSMENFDIENLNVSKNLKKVLARTLTYGEEKSNDYIEKIKAFFKGNFKERTIDDHRYFIEVLIIALLIKIANAKDIDTKIKLNQQLLGFFDLLLPRIDLIFTTSTDEVRKSLVQTIRQNINDTKEELIDLETQKQREIFRNSLEKLSVDNVHNIGDELDNLIITLFIPGDHPKDLKIEAERYFSEFAQYCRTNNLPNDFKNFNLWFKEACSGVNNDYSRILLNEKYFNILRRALLWGSNVQDLCESYSSGEEQLSEQIKNLTQPLNETEIEALFSTIDLNVKGESITASKTAFIQSVKEILDVKFELAKITQALSLVKDLEKSAGEMSTFFARESLNLVFTQMSAHLASLSVKLTNLTDNLRNFQEQNSKDLNRRSWSYRSTGKMLEVSNKLYPIIQDLLEASRNLTNQTHPQEIQRNLNKVKDLLWQLNSISKLLTNDQKVLKNIENDTNRNIRKIEILEEENNDIKLSTDNVNVLDESYNPLGYQRVKEDKDKLETIILEQDNLLKMNQVVIQNLKEEIIELKEKNQSNNQNHSIENSWVMVEKELRIENEKLKEEKDELNNQNELLNHSWIDLGNEKKVIETENEKLKREKGVLELENQRLLEEKNTVQNQLNIANDQINFLNQQNHNVQRTKDVKDTLSNGLDRFKVGYRTYNEASQKFGAFFKGMRARHGDSGITASGIVVDVINGRMAPQEVITFNSLYEALAAGVRANPKGGEHGHSFNSFIRGFKYELDLLRVAGELNRDSRVTPELIDTAINNVINKLNHERLGYSKDEVENLRINSLNMGA